MILFFVVLFLVLSVFGDESVDLLARLKSANLAVEKVLTDLGTRWHIQTHPNFLRSVSMSATSWEVMKLKYQSKILDAAAAIKGNGPTIKFVIGFMGSSVTAGHDSPFNVSFPVQTGLIMGPALEPLGISVISRNAAMGNNPCMPYDLCPRTYAGPDSDIVHWEQSFNCFGSDSEKRDIFEGFIRQAIAMPNNPVVVFTSSDTPNWNKKDCDGKNSALKPRQSEEDKKALDLLKHGEGKRIASEVNKHGPAMQPWGSMLEVFKNYQTRAGIQLWDHQSYKDYKCTGPYVPEWQNQGVASWHPSMLGHELRAAHYAYFWLLILKDAVNELQKNLTGEAAMSIASLSASVKKHIDLERKHIPAKPLFSSPGGFYTFPDAIQCITTFEPKHDPGAELKKYIVGGLEAAEGGNPWTGKIFEELTDSNIITKARSRGYKDFKHMLYGNKNSLPLHISITITKPDGGTGFLCQPPGNWGKLPNGFKNFWEVGTQVFLTTDVDSAASPFKFSTSSPKTTQLKYTNRKPKDTQTICVDFAPFVFPVGKHVLTVKPVSEENIMISTLLLPP